MDDYEKIMVKLDEIAPNWWLRWADQSDLRQLATGTATETTLRNRVALLLFSPIVQAAVDAGVCSYD